MLSRYDLRPYQDRGEQFIVDNPNAYLMLDPGLGKTIIGLSAFARMLESFDARRMLVMAPLRVARKVWKDEIRAWAHLQGLTISCVTGTWAEKLDALRVPADIHTINRESVQWLEAQFIQGKKQIKKWPWDLVVGDEFQGFRHQSSARYKSLNRLRRLFPRMVGLSGTCAPGGYHNLWSQYHLLDRGQRLGHTEQAFLDRWFIEPQRDSDFTKPQPLPGAREQIQRAIADITLSMRAKDYLDLPPVVHSKIMVELAPSIMARYKKFAREYVLELKDRNITAVNAGVLHGKLLQLANGAIYVDDKGNFELLHDEKIDALMERLEVYEGKPVLIGYNFKSDLKRIGIALDEHCKKSGKCWLNLRTDAQFDRWATGTVDFGVLHPGSAGHGLNDVYKSGAENLIWFGLNPDLELYLQLNARLTGGHRLVGRDVVIDHILAEGTQDEHTFDLLIKKDADQDDLTASMSRLSRGKVSV